MRVTQLTQYNNFVLNQQNTLSELNKVQTQIATGKKIENMYDDPVVFTKYLKLDEEINSFTQIKSSAQFAKTFANETDTALNDFVTTLDSFKTNLLKAANDTNDVTSREAIVKELQGELEHLKDLSNTSIDGKYIFSGSKFNTKPIDDNYEYQGNDQKVKAYLGAGVEREYNIDGKTLFLGRDDDYKKHLSLNVVQYDKMKANPEFVVRGSDGKLYIDKDIKAHHKIPDSEDVPTNEPITGESQIRMLTGVSDEYDKAKDKYSDGKSYFYLKGRKPNGETFTKSFALSNSYSVNYLLDKIGEAFGNTTTSKVVDVSLNDMGQIQIKDIASGKMVSDFYMLATNANISDPSKPNYTTDIKDLVKDGYYVNEFQKSDFDSVRDTSTITAQNKDFDNRVFKFASDFKLIDNPRNALPNDKLQDVLGSEAIVDGSDTQTEPVSAIKLSGTDTNGKDVSSTLVINSDTTMQNLMDKIKDTFGDVSVSLENGKLIITDNKVENKNDPSKLSVKLQAFYDADNDGGYNPADGDKLVGAFRRSDFANEDKLFLNSDGATIQGNVSQVIREGIRKIVVYDESGKPVGVREEEIENPQTYANKDTRLADVAGYKDSSELDGKEFVINFKDKDGNYKRAILTLRDTPYTDANGNMHYSTFWVDENNDGVRDDNEVYDIFGNSAGELTSANDRITLSTQVDPKTCKICTKENREKGMTYKQLNDVISLLVTGEYKNIDNSGDQQQEYDTTQQALQAAKTQVDTHLDDKGRLVLNDKTENPTKIKLSIFDKDTDSTSGDSPMLTFQSNDALTVDSPQVDFFGTLQKAIDSVANGLNYPDSEKSPRDTGIQGAIEAIDHLQDHIRRNHAKIGAVSNEFDLTIQRTDMLKVNVQQLQSDNIDTDIGEASMRLNSLQTSYQALLASIAKVNNITLLNYL